MTENLKVTHYRNGDEIQNVPEAEWGGFGFGIYGYYQNDSSNVENYGILYNIYAANDDRGICPEGWDVPTLDEWVELISYLGESAGGKLKSTGTIEAGNGLWYSPNTGATNESGFSAHPGGKRGGGFGIGSGLGYVSNFLASGDNNPGMIDIVYINYNDSMALFHNVLGGHLGRSSDSLY